MKNEQSEQAAIAWNQGAGIGRKAKVFPVKLTPEAEAIALTLDNRSKRLREWIVEGMKREGLLVED